MRETEVGRPLLHRLLEDRARLREVARAHQRIAEPHVDLRQIGSVDERRLPRACRFGVMAGRRERGGQIRQRGCRVVGIGLNGVLEAGLGPCEVVPGEEDHALIEGAGRRRRQPLAERPHRFGPGSLVEVKGPGKKVVSRRQEQLARIQWPGPCPPRPTSSAHAAPRLRIRAASSSPARPLTRRPLAARTCPAATDARA